MCCVVAGADDMVRQAHHSNKQPVPIYREIKELTNRCIAGAFACTYCPLSTYSNGMLLFGEHLPRRTNTDHAVLFFLNTCQGGKFRHLVYL